jgi:hypothetical protein
MTTEGRYPGTIGGSNTRALQLKICNFFNTGTMSVMTHAIESVAITETLKPLEGSRVPTFFAQAQSAAVRCSQNGYLVLVRMSFVH